MGLDTSHDCWHGAYSAFNRWRCKLAELTGIPLELMEGYYGPGDLTYDVVQLVRKATSRDGDDLYGRKLLDIDRWLPIKWSVLKPDVLHVLLDHSDCEGEIAAEHCGPLADRLEELLPLLPEGDAGGHIGAWQRKTQQFIDGLRLAAECGENVEFR